MQNRRLIFRSPEQYPKRENQLDPTGHGSAGTSLRGIIEYENYEKNRSQEHQTENFCLLM